MKTAQELLAALEPHEQVFAQEYARDGNGGRAYLVARPDVRQSSAYTMAIGLLNKLEVDAAIRAIRRESGADATVEVTDVLKAWARIAFAKPEGLARPRNLNCRHCYGVGHQYQWTDEAEYARACDEAFAEAERRDAAPMLPSCAGGFGFNAKLSPHAHCPKCAGEGYHDVYIEDSKNWSEGARALYAGIKRTKDGVEVKMRDQDAALLNIARYLGMCGQDVRLKGTVGVAQVGEVALTDEQRAALKAAVLGLVE